MTAALPDASVASLAGRCNRRRWDGCLMCNEPPVVHLVGMCVHEHVRESDYCETHAQHARARRFACSECAYSTERHQCLVSVVAEEPLS